MYERSDLERPVAHEIGQERMRSERFAHQLSEEAARQWQKALTGLIALPAAAALGVGAWALYAASFVERTFEIFEKSAQEMRRMADEIRREGRVSHPAREAAAQPPQPRA